MRPGSQRALDEFQRTVRSAVGRWSGDGSELVLTWGEAPHDLDLHLHVVGPDDETTVSYRQRGDLGVAPWAALDADVTGGLGPETIRIGRWAAASYHVAVYNYSNEVPLAGCGARVAVSVGNRRVQVVCPETGTGRWWWVAEIDGTGTPTMRVVNRLEDQPWE
jgi:hypothetical protein